MVTPYNDTPADPTPEGPRHRAESATQVAHPWITTMRTVVQTAIPSLLVFLLVVPQIIQIVVEGMGEQLPEGLLLWLTGAAAATTALAGVLARIFAIPAVNDALRGVGLKAPDVP